MVVQPTPLAALARKEGGGESGVGLGLRMLLNYRGNRLMVHRTGPVRTLVAVGDLSPVGRETLRLADQRFDVQAIVFPSARMYRAFRAGGNQPLPARLEAHARTVAKNALGRHSRWMTSAAPVYRGSWASHCLRWPEAEFDLLLSAGLPAIVPDDFLARASRTANVHTSLLPQLRGRHPHYWAIEWGLPRSGLTAHEMTSRVDRGATIGQVVVPIPAGTGYEQHYSDLLEALPELLDQVRQWCDTGERVEPVEVPASTSPGEAPT